MARLSALLSLTAWRALRDAARLPGLRFHDLRHTVVTRLLEAGEPDHVVESITGHLSRRMLEHYSHIRLNAKKAALDRLAASTKGATIKRAKLIADEEKSRMPPPDSRLPSAEDYASEPVKYPALVVVDVAAEQRRVTERYRNMVLNQVNTSCVRLAVFEGEYRWHHHPDSDELFLVVEGRLEIDLRDDRTLVLGPWQSVVIPAATVHRTRAVGRTVNLTFESFAAQTVFVD
jgi:mannose-6-phosphate isomerase-like protein (cupin superfamily)